MPEPKRRPSVPYEPENQPSGVVGRAKAYFPDAPWLRSILTHHVVGSESPSVSARDTEYGGKDAPPYYLIAGGNFAVTIPFQVGTVPERGINGVTNESLIAVVIDRLEEFQAGPYLNDFNERALGHLREGLKALQERTADRMRRGVEGKHQA